MVSASPGRSVHKAYKVTMLAKPSLIPGTGTGAGIKDSNTKIIKATAVSSAI